MDKVLLNVLGISYSQTQTGAYALILGEENGNRRIPIIIGGFEAQAIAIQLEGLKPPRPLTHDLFFSFATEYDIMLETVHIFRLEEGIFYSKLICNNGIKRIELDARTSDAIALALRFQCPIYTTEEIIERSGILFSSDPAGQPQPPAQKKSKGTGLKSQDIPELESLLNEAIQNEDYERASEIRDEIKRREKTD
ncbi:MAG: bifunctional nuclease family protein [Bacteroidales bacterium]|jgi:bifunctional DNase/RNase|nr:bifunctional nuclease family protein [Bacteroidales bacterium]